MKSVDISGKRNIDKIQRIGIPQRISSQKWTIDESYFIHSRQIQLINSIYLEDEVQPNNTHTIEPEKEVKKIMRREITKKINGYKNQDVHKKILDLTLLISLDQVIEKLMLSKMKCYYCKENCVVLYKDTLTKKQWTLDRIVNSIGHNHDNVVICCLECNIKRGDMDSERFKRGKEIKFVRKLF